MGLGEWARTVRRSVWRFGRCRMAFPPYDKRWEHRATRSIDHIRYRALALALHSLREDPVAGAMAELGVYRGETAEFLARAMPDRDLYLFDTFKGFPREDLEVMRDDRFAATSRRAVEQRLHGLPRVHIREGYFPKTTEGLESVQFAFVSLDADLYKPMLAGLTFFYPRLVPGGYMFLHDYHNPESNHAVSRAYGDYCDAIRESPVALPDRWGTLVLRKDKAG